MKGQLYNDSWTNIGVRWIKPNFEDPNLTAATLGGLELYVNLEMVGRSVMPEYTEAGSTQFLPWSQDRNQASFQPFLTEHSHTYNKNHN